MPVGTFVNPEIIMGYKSPDLSGLDPATMMKNVLAYKQAKTQQQANELALQQSQQKIADQNLMQEAYNAQDPVNYLRGLGRVDLADAFAAKRNEAQAAELELKTKGYESAKKSDEAIAERMKLIQGAYATIDPNSPDAPQRFKDLSKAVHDDDTVGPWLNSLGASHERTVADVDNAVANGTFTDYFNRSFNSVQSIQDQLKANIKDTTPKPTEVNLGGTVVFVDMNPYSKTYLQKIIDYSKTATPGEVLTNQRVIEGRTAAGTSTNLNRTTLNLTPDQYDALTTAIVEGRLDPSKVNSRNASILAGVALKDRHADFNQLTGNATLLRNVAYQQKAQMALALPTVLTNLEASGKKLNYSDNKWVAGLEAWGKGVNQDPQLVDYMAQRNDAILSIAAVARGVGMSDFATKLENEVSSPHMSPKALESYIAAQRKSLEPRLEQYRSHSLKPPTTPTTPPTTPTTPPAASTAQTVPTYEDPAKEARYQAYKAQSGKK